jgi:hypothetical protein
VPEGGVDDGIAGGCPTAQAFQVFQIAAMHLRAGGCEQLGALIAARKTKHLVACVDELRNESRTDEACRARNKHTHGFSPKHL